MSTRDDYVDFCEGVRELTGMDLASYKRPQMERRIRAFAEAQHGVELPEPTSASCGAAPTRASASSSA